MGDVSGESDHAPFAFRAGVPVANVRFSDAALAAATANASAAFPAYHTAYDNLDLYSMVDGDHSLLLVCSRLMAHVARRLADQLVVPHDVVGHAERMAKAVESLR